MIRTNSKVSNTNSGQGTGRQNAKSIMKSMLKKKSTMLFIQENKELQKLQKLQKSTIEKQKDEISPVNQLQNNFVRTTTLMPDFA
jgi:hypothetical protein